MGDRGAEAGDRGEREVEAKRLWDGNEGDRIASVNPFDEETRNGLEALCRQFAVHGLKLVGSAARRDFEPGTSDIDLLVVFDLPPQGIRPSVQYFGFKEALEKLFGRPVDLLEESAVTNHRLKREIDADAIELYAA